MKSFKQFLNEIKMDQGIHKHLLSLGYTFLGTGLDQQAYLEPGTGKVLKIFGAVPESGKKFKDASGFGLNHHMFKNWVQYCERNKSNIFLPRFDGWESFEYNGEKYLQIRMERLQKLPSKLSEFLEALAYAAEDFPEEVQKIKQEITDNIGKLDPDKNTRLYNMTFASYGLKVFDEINELIILLGKDGFDKLFDTIIEISDLGKDLGYTQDLHGGNFMHRNDGVPVIVDPWVI